MTMTQRTTPKTFLLSGTVIPALALLALPCNAATLQSGEKILLAQQQEAPPKDDRPERKRPEGAPSTPAPPGAGRPSQVPPQAPQERRESPKGPAQAQPPATGQPPAPPTKQVTPPTQPTQSAPPAKQTQPSAP